MNETVFDARWFTRVQKACVFDRQWLTESTVVSKNERVRFLENEVENPVFTTVTCDMTELAHRRSQWLSLLDEVREHEENDTVRELYEQKILRQLTRIALIEAVCDGDDAAFTQASIALYGKPKKRFFQYIAARMQTVLVETADTEFVRGHRVLEHIFKKIDASHNTITPTLLPSPVTCTQHLERGSEVVSVFWSVLKRHQLTDWTVVTSPDLVRRVFKIDAKTRTIVVPDTSCLAGRTKPLTTIGVQALAEHEIGVHIAREHEGAQQSLRLLAIGLPGYVRGEEGVATYRQQCIEGAREYYGFDRYMAIALVLGLDGTPRDFRGLFDVMQHYYALLLPPGDDTLNRARVAAWDVCLRTFRGTTGQQIGFCFTRDINYLEGNIGIWQLLAEQPAWESFLTVGKYDPLNKQHIEALRTLEILPI